MLDEKLLLKHGTYSVREIKELKALQKFTEKNGWAGLVREQKLRLLNFLFLTTFECDTKYKSVHPSRGFYQRLDKESQELLECIFGDTNKFRSEVGYKFSTTGSPSPFSILYGFEIKPQHRYIDVGCGFGVRTLEVFKRVGCETYLLDPNAYNIRIAYQFLIEEGLSSEERIKIVLSTVQKAKLVSATFDRAYLGTTLALETSESGKEILESTVNLMCNGGVIAVVGTKHGVSDRISVPKGINLEEQYVTDKGGFDIRLVTVKRKT